MSRESEEGGLHFMLHDRDTKAETNVLVSGGEDTHTRGHAHVDTDIHRSFTQTPTERKVSLNNSHPCNT